MKKNNRTYLLMALVLGVWGVIGFKVFKASNPSPVQTAAVVSNETFMPKQLKKRDTFSILANYRDPFLGTVKAPRKKRKPTPKKIIKQVPDKVILYTGFIGEKTSQRQLFFVTVDGQQQMMAPNETFREVKLIGGNENTIRVRYKGSTKKIALKQ